MIQKSILVLPVVRGAGVDYTSGIMRSLLLGLCLVTVSTQLILGQQGELMNRAVEESPLTFGTGVVLVAALSGAVAADQPPAADEAIRVLDSLGYRLPEVTSDSALSYGGFALLVMQAFDLHGGLRYEVFPSPASALEELQTRYLVVPGIYPGTAIPGVVAVDLISNLISGES